MNEFDLKVKRLYKLLKLKSRLAEIEKTLKAEIQAEYKKQKSDEQIKKKQKSEYIAISGLPEQLRITTSEPDPVFDFETFRKLINDDELFYSLIKITGATLNIEAWEEAVKQELVLDSFLDKSAVDKTPSVSVSFSKGV